MVLVGIFMLIKKILEELGNQLGNIILLNEVFLASCHRTAFCWTQQSNSLCLAMDKTYLHMAMKNPNIMGISTLPSLASNETWDIPKCIFVLEEPAQFFYYVHNAKLHESLACQPFDSFIHPSAKISPRAIIAPQVYIAENVQIHDGAVILNHTVIGKDSIIYENVTVGTEGFFSKMVLGEKIHIEHFGGVKIGENCILHAGCNISRAVHWGEYTTLGDHSHIGIQTNIAHDCQIGEHCNISAKVCFSGRVRVGHHVWIGAGAVLSNGVHIHDQSEVKIGAVVINDVPAQAVVSGNFASSHKKRLRDYVTMV